jgi:hypothetical protein
MLMVCLLIKWIFINLDINLRISFIKGNYLLISLQDVVLCVYGMGMTISAYFGITFHKTQWRHQFPHI